MEISSPVNHKILVVEKPWGSFNQFTLNETTTVKLLRINAECRFSYQFHEKRSEFWQVVKGRVKVTLDGETRILDESDSIEIHARAKHRAQALAGSAVILEIARGEFDENDIVRIEDDYNRVPQSTG